MKALSLLFLLFMCSYVYANPQSKPSNSFDYVNSRDMMRYQYAPIEFLSIPLNSKLDTFIDSLREKGFYIAKKQETPILEGDFMGKRVQLFPIANLEGWVSDVAIVFPYASSLEEVVQEYNSIFDRFSNNKKYTYFSGGMIAKLNNASFNHAELLLMLAEPSRCRSTFLQVYPSDDIIINSVEVNKNRPVSFWIESSDSRTKYRIIMTYTNSNNLMKRPEF